MGGDTFEAEVLGGPESAEPGCAEALHGGEGPWTGRRAQRSCSSGPPGGYCRDRWTTYKMSVLRGHRRAGFWPQPGSWFTVRPQTTPAPSGPLGPSAQVHSKSCPVKRHCLPRWPPSTPHSPLPPFRGPHAPRRWEGTRFFQGCLCDGGPAPVRRVLASLAHTVRPGTQVPDTGQGLLPLGLHSPPRLEGPTRSTCLPASSPCFPLVSRAHFLCKNCPVASRLERRQPRRVLGRCGMVPRHSHPLPFAEGLGEALGWAEPLVPQL